MITQFKIFEIINFGVNLEEIKTGDYVLFKPSNSWIPKKTWKVIDNKIAEVIRIRKHYNELDVDFGGNIGALYGVDIGDVKYWSNDKSELETFITAKKYNL
jgi:predicted acetyltransferase